MLSSYSYHAILSNKQRKQRQKRINCGILFFIFSIIVAVFICLNIEAFLWKIVISNGQLQPDSKGFRTWLNPPISTVRTYHLFNVTNHREFIFNPKKTPLNVTDTRGYVYDMKSFKKNVQWSPDHQDFTYEVERLITRNKKKFHPSSVNDQGYFVDMLRAMIRTQFEPKPAPAFFSFAKYNPFYHVKSLDVLEGFQPALLEKAREKMMGPNTDKYGLIYRQNGSRLYTVNSKTKLEEKGRMLQFASDLIDFNITSPSFYDFPVYDGLTFPIHLFDKPRVHVFNSDFCRPIRLQYNGTVSKFGFPLLFKYTLKLIDTNQCVFNATTNQTECPEVDKLDVSKCFSSSVPENTIFLSKAHFYGAQEETTATLNINGLKPNVDEHDSNVYFEPRSGTPIEGIYRIQLNINAMIDQMEESDNAEGFRSTNTKGVRRMLPVFWIDQKVQLQGGTSTILCLIANSVHYRWMIFISAAIAFSIGFVVLLEIFARRRN